MFDDDKQLFLNRVFFMVLPHTLTIKPLILNRKIASFTIEWE